MAANPILNLGKVLRISPESRPQTYMSIFDAADPRDTNYWLELALSSAIATLGLILNTQASPAVIVGAMLISPMMHPVAGAALALASGDLYLAVRSTIGVVLSMSATVILSALLAWLLPFHSPTAEILARSRPGLLDLLIALFSGIAAAILLVRGSADRRLTALPGVLIGHALMPPLCVVGFGVGIGFHGDIMSGAMLLFLTNLATIIASAFGVFLAVRMDAPGIRYAIESALQERGSNDWIFRRISGTRLRSLFGQVGHLRFRVVLILVAFLLLGPPLVSAFRAVRDEAVARAAISGAIPSLVPRGALVTSDTDIGPDRILVSLVVAEDIPADRVTDMEKQLVRQTGKDVSIQIRRVAGAEEVARLRERMRTAPAPEQAPMVRDIESIRADVLGRLRTALNSAWPEDVAEMRDAEIGFRNERVVARIAYRGKVPLPESTRKVLESVLRARLGDSRIQLVLEKEK